MSPLENRLRGARAATWTRGTYAVGRIRRLSAGPALARLGSTIAAMIALIVAVPRDLLWSADVRPQLPLVLTIMFAVSAGVGLFPRTRWVSLVAVGAVGAWLLASVVFGDPVGVARVGLLTAALYLMHAGATLAAVLPYDCVVAPGVLARWFASVGGVLGVGLAVGLGGMVVTGQVPATPTVTGPIVGALAAAGLAGLLAWQLRRR